MRRASGVAVVAFFICAVNGGEPPTMSPAWKWTSTSRVEWTECVARADGDAILVCTSDGKIAVLDASSGRSLLPAPIEAGQGVRFAPYAIQRDAVLQTEPASSKAATVITYCFDRRSLYAVELGASAKLSWSRGRPAKESDAAGIDPEFLPRIVAAIAIDAGLIVLSSDGTLALHDQATGDIRWSKVIEQRADVRIHADGRRLAVLGNVAGRVRATFVDLSSPDSVCETHDLGALSVIWSALCNDGLLVAESGGAGVFESQRMMFRPLEFRGDVALLARSAGLFRLRDPDGGAGRETLAVASGKRFFVAPLGSGSSMEYELMSRDASDLIVRGTEDRLMIGHSGGVEVFVFSRSGRVKRSVFLHETGGATEPPRWRAPIDIASAIEGVYFVAADVDEQRVALFGPVRPKEVEQKDITQLTLPPPTWVSPVCGQVGSALWTNAHIVIIAGDSLVAYPYRDVSKK